ncbi:MAG: response regulator [Lachnospiraceae bacterium]|nr:response regulator [Lachnospiraceae bacterium]
MYKVIIVDDEPIIVEGMSKAIPWADFDCEVVSTAEDGNDGVRLVKELKPDIIFTDICMPGMDGLMMIAAVKSEYPDIEISILTGYRDFDYAQEAIKLGVTRFIVKPSKKHNIFEALEAMILNISKRKHEQSLGLDTASLDGSNEINAAGSFVVSNAIKYIKENYKEKINLSDLAEHVYVSQWHLSRLLNEHTKQSFYDLLNGVRIEKAKELLADPLLRIGDISDEVGFLDLTHFSKVFKKLEGMTANEYRNKILS